MIIFDEKVYAVNYKHWVSFENVKTMAAKANFVQQMGYGGYVNIIIVIILLYLKFVNKYE